jgi:hypothetical protein
MMRFSDTFWRFFAVPLQVCRWHAIGKAPLSQNIVFIRLQQKRRGGLARCKPPSAVRRSARRAKARGA